MNFNPQEKEEVMQIVTSWMREGIGQGIEQGIWQGIEREKDLIIRQVQRKIGNIESDLQSQIKALEIEDVETLGEALFDFSSVDDLKKWLNNLKN